MGRGKIQNTQSALFAAEYVSPLGKIILVSDGKVLRGLYFEGQKYFPKSLPPVLDARGGCGVEGGRGAEGGQNAAVFEGAFGWLDAYFSGKPVAPVIDADRAEGVPKTVGVHGINGFPKTVGVQNAQGVLGSGYAQGVENARKSNPSPALCDTNTPTSKNANDGAVVIRFSGTPFQKTVWQILLSIPYGKTMTYGEIARVAAKKLGLKTMSAQAVGGAVGRNPISIIVPCHRVVGADRSLTGYAGGIDKKAALLRIEGVLRV